MGNEADMIRLYSPPQECADGRCEDLFPAFLYCVLIPGTVLLLLLLLLAVGMCCASTSCKCKKDAYSNSQTNDIQLENYNSIRRASAHLRQMSQHRDSQMMGSRAGSMTLDRSHRRPPRVRSCHSAPGTLQRHHRNRHQQDESEAPPPPPPYSEHSENTFLGRAFLEQESHPGVRYLDNPEQNGSGAEPLLYHRPYEN